jgi:hypothetical protein
MNDHTDTDDDTAAWEEYRRQTEAAEAASPWLFEMWR